MSCEKVKNQLIEYSPLNKKIPDWCLKHLEVCDECNKFHGELFFLGSELDTYSNIKAPVKSSIDLKTSIISDLKTSSRSYSFITSVFYGLLATGFSYLLASSNLDFKNHSLLEIVISTVIWLISYSVGFHLLSKKSKKQDRDLSSLIRISLYSTVLFLMIDRFIPLSSIVDFCNINSWPHFLVNAVGQKGLFFLMGSAYAAVPIFLLSFASAKKYHGTALRGAMIAGSMFFLMVSPSIFLQCQSFTFGILSSWLIGSFIGASVGGMTGIKIYHTQFETV